MNRTHIRIMALVLAVLLVSSALALAAEIVTGTIQDMDRDRGTFTLLTKDDETMMLKVNPQFLEGIEVGDRVYVEIDNGVLKVLHKEGEES